MLSSALLPALAVVLLLGITAARGPGRLVPAVLCGGLLWSGLELLRLLQLGLLRFTSTGALLLFFAGHGGLCVAAALALALVYAAPARLGPPRAALAVWLWALVAAIGALGFRLSLSAPPPAAWLLGGAALLGAAPLCHLAAGDLLGPWHRPRPRRAAALLVLAAAAAAFNGHYLPQQLLHLHGAVTTFGLALSTLGAAWALPRPGRRARRAALLAAAALVLAAGLAHGSAEVRFALFVLGQESRAAVYAVRKVAGGQPLRDWQGARPAPARLSRPPCGPPLARRVVLVTIDSLRADHLRAYGYARETAPHLTALSGRSALFLHAYAGAPATSPAVRRLFSVEWRGSRRVSRLGRALAAAGVRSEAVVAERLTRYFGEGVNGVFTTLHGVPVAHDVVDRALAPVAERVLGAAGPSPAFFWVHLASPHLPYLRWPEGPDFGPRAVDRYDGEIAEADRALGRLLAALARHPDAAATALIVTADHGEELPGEGHGAEGHGRHGLFEEEIRVPLLLSVPGRGPRRVVDLVSHDDVAPTVAALLGACGVAFRGRSLLPALDGAPLPPRPVLVGPRGPLLGGALIDAGPGGAGRWKLGFVLWGGALALYDLEDDPGERLNRITARPEVAARLLGRLREELSALPPGWSPRLE